MPPSNDLTQRVSGCLLAALACAGLAGCGDTESIPRAVVSGDVAFDGKPVARGRISYYPIDGTPGPVSSAIVMDGKYTVTDKGGVPVGVHRVEIEGYKPPPPEEGPDAGRVQYLPAKYNRQSELRAEVPSTDSVSRDFKLAP